MTDFDSYSSSSSTYYGTHVEPGEGGPFAAPLGTPPAALATVPTSSERLAALLAHGGTFVAWTLAPLIVYALKRGESKYVEFQALQALLWSLAGTIVSLATCGLAIPVFMVWHAIALWKVSEGHAYEYPVVGAIARSFVYEDDKPRAT
jgi:uncharacterized Tic20 family protein